MQKDTSSRKFAGLLVTSLGTLVSRVLGLVRDIATAALFGLSEGGIMDAFVVAFRVPNLFRRLFGEGALAASYLPVLTEQLDRDRHAGWQLASVTFTLLAVGMSGILLLCEFACLAIGYWGREVPGLDLTLGLTAVMLPYMVLMCLVAQVAATLHAVAHFSTPALSPAILNVFWLAAVWGVAPRFADKQTQAYVLAVSVVLAGFVQLAIQLPPLWKAGFRFDYHWQRSRAAVGEVAWAMLPMLLGLAVVQLNTLLDSMLAWGLAATPETGSNIAWLGEIRYPMQQGAASAVYYGERLYQFPLGILGVAVATVIFPLLSRHAARGDFQALGADLTLGLRLVLLLGIPSSAGLMLLADPISTLLFERGEFTAEDAGRTARMIICYSAAVWAYCALPVLVRGFYALGDRRTPVWTGAAMIGLNLGVSLALLWPVGETALAIGTSTAAIVQTLLLAMLFSRQKQPLEWNRIVRTALVSFGGTLVMWLACYWSRDYLAWEGSGTANRLLAVALPMVVALAVYPPAVWLLGRDELSLLGLRARPKP